MADDFLRSLLAADDWSLVYKTSASHRNLPVSFANAAVACQSSGNHLCSNYFKPNDYAKKTAEKALFLLKQMPPNHVIYIRSLEFGLR